MRNRDREGQLQGFYNVCLHRAGPVACGKGNRKTLQCRYHGWTYNLQGKLLRSPEFEGAKNWNAEQFSLRKVLVEEWGPFVFVNLNPDSKPLQHFLGNIPNEVREKSFAIDDMKLVERREYTIKCNWKVYIDNYLEGYHIPIAHPGLYREIDYEKYRVDTYEYYSSQYAPIRPLKTREIAGRDRRYLRSEGEDQALYYWVFPNFMLNFYPDNLQMNVILPIDHKTTLTIFEWYFQQPGTGSGWESLQESISFSDQVQQEDIEICENVQVGLESGVYHRGRFSPKRENGVHHFQKLVHRFLHD